MNDKMVGFIGLGCMGLPMARNLLKAGFHLIACDVRQAPLREIGALGAETTTSPLEVGKADIIIIMVQNFPQAREVLIGKKGVLESMRQGSVIVVMSTISPVEIKMVAKEAEDRGIRTLDAPVSGGVKGATEGTLSIMAGGTKEIFEHCKPLLSVMGKNIFHVGEVGIGQTVKMISQLMFCVGLVASAEAMVLGSKAGVDPNLLLKVVGVTAGDSLAFRREVPLMIARNFETQGALRILTKDTKIVLDVAGGLGVPVLLTSVAHQIYRMAEGRGLGDEDDAAVVKVIEEWADTKVGEYSSNQP